MNSEPQEIAGVPPYAVAFYAHSIELAATLAVASFGGYTDELNGDQNALVMAGELQNALAHCAMISRFFFPSKSAGKFGLQRGNMLRKKFQIEDHSPFADRSLRNTLEHFDERLDKWIPKNPVGPIVLGPIVNDHSLVEGGFGHVFKLVYPENDVFVVLGEKFEFGALARATYNIAYPNYEDDFSENHA